MYNTTEFKVNELLGSVESLIKWNVHLSFVHTARYFYLSKQKEVKYYGKTNNYNNNIGTIGLMKQNFKLQLMFKQGI